MRSEKHSCKNIFSILIFAGFFQSFIFNPSASLAQKPFRLSSPGDVITAGVLIPVNIGAHSIYKNKSSLTIEKINTLDAADINSFDRSAVKHYSIASEKTSNVLLASCVIAPAFLMFDKNMREDAGVKGVIYIEALAITAAELQLVKGLISRPRPFVYNPDVPVHKKLKPDANCSFFSGHTATASAACYFMASMYAGVYPSKNEWLWFAAAAPALATGFFRYSAGKHFFSDILTGFVVGSLNGYIVTKLHSQ